MVSSENVAKTHHVVQMRWVDRAVGCSIDCTSEYLRHIAVVHAVHAHAAE